LGMETETTGLFRLARVFGRKHGENP
jgi:hypothetical protein